MISEIIIASGNPGKAREIAKILSQAQILAQAEYGADGLGIRVLTIKEAIGETPEVVENGLSLSDNAWLKADAARSALTSADKARSAGAIVAADDSGLFVDCLGGRPGIHSARYGGAGATYADKIQMLLKEIGAAEEAQAIEAQAAEIGAAEEAHTTEIAAAEARGSEARAAEDPAASRGAEAQTTEEVHAVEEAQAVEAQAAMIGAAEDPADSRAAAEEAQAVEAQAAEIGAACFRAAEDPAASRGAAGFRAASFRCVMAVSCPDGGRYTAEGECRGLITHAPTGSNGFGYDPIFFAPQYGRTMAELTEAEKNRISHRGIAVRRMAAIIKSLTEQR